AAAVFDLARAILGASALDACRRGGDVLVETLNEQPAVMACEIAHFVAWEASSTEAPAAVAGHSLGQLAALVVAGAIDLEAGFALVAERARAMQAASVREPGRMGAGVGLPLERGGPGCGGRGARRGVGA